MAALSCLEAGGLGQAGGGPECETPLKDVVGAPHWLGCV